MSTKSLRRVWPDRFPRGRRAPLLSQTAGGTADTTMVAAGRAGMVLLQVPVLLPEFLWRGTVPRVSCIVRCRRGCTVFPQHIRPTLTSTLKIAPPCGVRFRCAQRGRRAAPRGEQRKGGMSGRTLWDRVHPYAYAVWARRLGRWEQTYSTLAFHRLSRDTSKCITGVRVAETLACPLALTENR
eukprot:gene24874-biopygen14983